VLHGEELSKAYASADLFVFPSTTDTYGNVVVEALASGLPVIVSNQGGPGELLRDPDDGEAIVTGDTPAWVRAIEKGLARPGGLDARQKRRDRTIHGRSWNDAFRRFWNNALL
jgi:glycosyltransferase involved in cell wall biosynthesis